MDLTLTPEQELVRETAREFVDREIVPHARRVGPRRAGGQRHRRQARRLGFLGLTIPEEYGGCGGDHVSYCLVLEELGRGDSAVRGIVSVSLGLVGKTIAHWHRGAEAPSGCRGCAPATRSAASRSPSPTPARTPASLTTRAVRDGDDWVLNGAKMFITNGTWAERRARLRPHRRRRARGHHARSWCRRDAPGSRVAEIHGKLGLRGQATAELTFDGRPGARRRRWLGEDGEGFRVAMAALTKGRMSLAAGCVGIAPGLPGRARASTRGSAAVRQADRVATSWCSS